MALNFPPSPAVDQIHNDGVRSWKWNGTAWDSYNAAQTVTTVNGMTGAVNFVAKQGITYSVSGGTYSFGVNYLRGGSTLPSVKYLGKDDVLLLQQSIVAGATMYTTTIKNLGFFLSGSSTKVTKDLSGEYIKLFTDGVDEVTEKSISFSDFKNELIGISGSVTSFNGLTGAVGITAGNQITLTKNGNIFSIGVIEGSTSGLDADTLRGVSGQRFIENLQTGLLYGGLISVNAGNTGQVDITAGAGIIVSPGASLTAYPIPTVIPVTWTAKTGVTLSGLTSSDETWLAIDSSGNLVQTNVVFTDAQYSSEIPLGAALHLSRTFIQLVKTYPHVSYAQPDQFDPFIRAFGNLKLSGHEITANGANLLVNRSAGKAYALGRNYKNDPNNPNIVTDTSAIPVTTIYHFYRNGSGAFTTTINGAIIPGSLDNGTGTLATVTSAKYTIQRIFYLPDQPTLLGVYYGRQEYNSISDAQANIPFEEFSESESTATQGIFCGWLIVQGNTTALNTTTKAKFINAGLFRNTANIGGGGLAIASIDDLNDVTTTTPTNNQVLRWDSGTAQWVNSDVSSLAVSSFNGLTGAVTGVTTGISNSFTPIQSFLGGISVSGATFSDNVRIVGDLIVTGRIITETGMFGATYNAAIEVVDNLSMDGGEF